MSRSLKYILLLSILTAHGCASAPKFQKIDIGMTEEQTIALLGEPESIAVQGTTKYYEYVSWWGLEQHDYTKWYVRFIDGRVESYGQKGDFDSTKDATQNININLDSTSRTTSSPPAQPAVTINVDLESELRRLEKMRKENLISQEEFDVLRKRVIDKASVY